MIRFIDSEIERLLKGLPKFKRDSRKEAEFFSLLNKKMKERNGCGHTWFRNLWLTRGVVTLGLILLVAGISIFSYDSSITSASKLYSVKKALEKGELFFSFSPISKVQTHLRFSDRRFRESREIINKNDSLSWLIPSVSALDTVNQLNLNSKEEMALAITLFEMHTEIENASQIVIQKLDGQDARAALESIATVADHHIDKLRKLKGDNSKEIYNLIGNIIVEEDLHVAAVIEAKEGLEYAMIKKDQLKKITLRPAETKQIYNERPDEAAKDLTAMMQAFDLLSKDEQKPHAKKVEAAQDAFNGGKFGRAQGLSRAILNQVPTKK